ncbi:MAG: ribonuclease HII [Thermodesulfobacteriota bacteirum]|nr:ribonuclease HII [Thermodesulfobacteriota bacterium]
MKDPNLIEIELLKSGKVVVGIDEVGRGSLVGPVVACAFILNPSTNHIQVNDSKILSENERTYAFAQLIITRSTFTLGYATHKEIDEINILNATKLAMSRAVAKLKTKNPCLLIDGNQKIGTELEEICVVKGDQKCKSIASASIIAKITRDFILKKVSQIYPYYNLENNKGYGTKQHVELIKKFGPSPFHRTTFKIR